MTQEEIQNEQVSRLTGRPYVHPKSIEAFESVYRDEYKRELESCDRWIKWCQMYGDSHGVNFHQGTRSAHVFNNIKMEQLLRYSEKAGTERMISFKDLRDQVKRAVWPYPGEAESLVEAHDGHFLTAMIDLGKWIECLQDNHTDVNPACSTYVECGKTILEAPVGIIKAVYTLANADWCSKVYYSPDNYERVECWSRNLLTSFVPPANTGMPALQLGLKYAEKSTDNPLGRSRVGIWALHRKRLYLAPWVQSNEWVIVEWDGVKTDWHDDDVLDDENYWTADVVDVLKSYMKWQHLVDFEPGASIQDKRDAQASYENGRADLIYWCDKRTREQAKSTLCQNPIPTQQQLLDEAVPTAVPTTFAIIGDYGNGSAEEIAVAGVVNSWEPDYIVTLGNNWFGSAISLSDLDAKVGQFFHDFLHPYTGSFGAGADTQLFFPALGDHDRDPEGRLALVMQYFNLSNSYYDLVKGAIHFFFYDSGYDTSDVLQQADGVAAGSVQAQWLRAKLALSTAAWKIVVVHHPPFSSTASSAGDPQAGDGTLSYPALRLPFKDWGADLLLSGHAHNYERLQLVSGLPAIVAGSGGEPGDTPATPAAFRATPITISMLRYNDKFGALRGTVDCSTLTLEFINTDGAVIDTMTIQK